MFGIFFVLQGLVRAWYIVLGQRLVAFQAEISWTRESWLLSGRLGDTATRWVASAL